MSRPLLTVACAVDGLLTLLFTQAGMFFVGKTHADVKHGIAPHALGFGLSGSGVAMFALLLAVCLLCHGLWCWRRLKTQDAHNGITVFDKVVVITAPLTAALIGIALATSLIRHGAV